MTNYRAAILADIPYAYYRLGEPNDSFPARDDGAAGHGYDGAIHGNVFGLVGGLITGDPDVAKTFDGASGYISLPSAFNVGGWASISLECWIQIATDYTDTPRLLANSFTQSDHNGFDLAINAHGADGKFWVGNGTTNANAIWNTSFSNGTYYLVATWDSHNLKTYVNGVLKQTTAYTGGGLGLGASGYPITIGRNPAYAGDYAPYVFDEVAIYGYALTQAQITNHRTVGLNSTNGPWTLQISRKPYVIQAGSLSCDLAISRVGQASVQVKTADSIRFQKDQPVCIYDASGQLYYSGYVDVPTTTKPGFPAILLHQLAERDQHWLTDKRVVFDTGTNLAKVYTGKGYDYIVQDIQNNILSQEGVTIGQLYGLAPSTTLAPSTSLAPLGPSQIIPVATFNFPTCSQVLDALAKASSNATNTFYWFIDKYKRLYFLPYSAVTGPSVDGTTIDDGRLSHKPPRLIPANPLYYNKQYVPGGTDATLVQLFSFVGDGNVTTWTMSNPVGAAPVVYVNGTSQSVGRLNLDPSKAFYWSLGSNTISAPVAPAVGAVGLIIWNPQVPTTGSYTNSTEVTNQAAIDETSGIIESVVKDTSITSTGNAVAEAQANVQRNSQRGQMFQFTTRDTGYAPGQLLSVTYASFGFSSTAMLVESVHVDDSDGLNAWYTVTAVVGPYDSTWAAFFGSALNVQPSAQSISIGV